jgi:hypothetical protein
MAMKTIVAALALMLAMPVRGAEWWFVTAGQEAAYYVDMTSLRQEGIETKIWVQIVYKTFLAPSPKIKFVNVRYIVNCDAETVAKTTMVMYLSDLSVYSDPSGSTKAPVKIFQDIVPDSIDDNISDMICSAPNKWVTLGNKLENGVTPLMATQTLYEELGKNTK